MARKQCISPRIVAHSDAIRRRLDETNRLAARLRVLLRIAERLEKTRPGPDDGGRCTPRRTAGPA